MFKQVRNEVLAELSEFAGIAELFDKSRYPITRTKFHVHTQKISLRDFFDLYDDLEGEEQVEQSSTKLDALLLYVLAKRKKMFIN